MHLGGCIAQFYWILDWVGCCCCTAGGTVWAMVQGGEAAREMSAQLDRAVTLHVY